MKERRRDVIYSSFALSDSMVKPNWEVNIMKVGWPLAGAFYLTDRLYAPFHTYENA